MQLRLLEIELHSDDPEASRRFYSDQLGLQTMVDLPGLKVFDPGVAELDFNKSRHFPRRVSSSFFASDIEACISELKEKGVEIMEHYGDPVSAIVLKDPDGCSVEIKKERG